MRLQGFQYPDVLVQPQRDMLEYQATGWQQFQIPLTVHWKKQTELGKTPLAFELTFKEKGVEIRHRIRMKTAIAKRLLNLN